MTYILPFTQQVFSTENLLLHYNNFIRNQYSLELTIYNASEVFQRMFNAMEKDLDARKVIDSFREFGFATSQELDDILTTVEDKVHELYYYYLINEPKNVITKSEDGLVQGKFSIKFKKKVTLYYEFNLNGQGVIFVKG